MKEFLKKTLRLSSFLKVLTLICLGGLLLAYMAPFVHPNTLKLLPFFGLTYPILLLFSIVFLLIWTLARSRMALLVLLVLLIGGKLHFRMIALGSNPGKQAPIEEQLHVMSYNVRLFDLYTASPREVGVNKAKIFDYLRAENPDIVCFQEFYQQDKPTNFPTKDSIIQFLKIKDYHERYAHKLKGRQNFGVTIFSKYPMIARGDVNFENQSENDFNYCIYADIIKNQDTFRIYNVHLQSIRLQSSDYSAFTNNGKAKPKSSTIRLMIDKLLIAYPKRAQQARRVMEHIILSPYPTIVCGDFNDTPLSYTYHQFNKYLIDSYRNTSKGIGTTYVGKVPAGRIDYIFHTKGLQSADFKIQEEALSDHLAISCKIFKK